MPSIPPPPPLPPKIAARLAELRAAPARSASDLRELVAAHRQRAEDIAENDPFVDVDRARRVADSCLALLDALPTLPDDARAWVRAACLYFADPDDEEDDFDSVVGFDDDAEVVNHVAARVGLSRLSVPRT